MVMQIGNYKFHNKEQWDLNIKPLLCVHKKFDNGNICKRIFCLYYKNGFKVEF